MCTKWFSNGGPDAALEGTIDSGPNAALEGTIDSGPNVGLEEAP